MSAARACAVGLARNAGFLTRRSVYGPRLGMMATMGAINPLLSSRPTTNSQGRHEPSVGPG
jgi:hypothetical protein